MHTNHELRTDTPEASAARSDESGSDRIETRAWPRAAGVAICLSILAGIGFGVHSTWPATQTVNSGEPAIKRVPVVLTAAREMTFERAVVVSGNVQAKNYALISARMPGAVDTIFVDRGDAVQAGQTKLFQSDALKLTKAVAIARQGLQVAELSVEEKEANLEQVQAGREQAESDAQRYRALVLDHAIPKQLHDQHETRLKQACALVRHGEALLALDKSRLEQARLQVTMAEKDLADSLVIAPISGRISQRFLEPGEMAAPGTPVLKIEDPSLLEVSVFLPEEHYARVAPGQTQVRISVAGIDAGVRPVTYKSPTVNPKLRTFEIKGLIESPPVGIAPGCLAEVVVVLESHQGLGIPTPAIQQRGGRSVVFVVEQDRAHLKPVQPGLSMNVWTEIEARDLASGGAVVTMGQQLLDEGTPVVRVEEAAQ